jgi:hypothetical protein
MSLVKDIKWVSHVPDIAKEYNLQLTKVRVVGVSEVNNDIAFAPD